MLFLVTGRACFNTTASRIKQRAPWCTARGSRQNDLGPGATVHAPWAPEHHSGWFGAFGLGSGSLIRGARPKDLSTVISPTLSSVHNARPFACRSTPQRLRAKAYGSVTGIPRPSSLQRSQIAKYVARAFPGSGETMPIIEWGTFP